MSAEMEQEAKEKKHIAGSRDGEPAMFCWKT